MKIAFLMVLIILSLSLPTSMSSYLERVMRGTLKKIMACPEKADSDDSNQFVAAFSPARYMQLVAIVRKDSQEFGCGFDSGAPFQLSDSRTWSFCDMGVCASEDCKCFKDFAGPKCNKFVGRCWLFYCKRIGCTFLLPSLFCSCDPSLYGTPVTSKIYFYDHGIEHNYRPPPYGFITTSYIQSHMIRETATGTYEIISGNYMKKPILSYERIPMVNDDYDILKDASDFSLNRKSQQDIYKYRQMDYDDKKGIENNNRPQLLNEAIESRMWSQNEDFANEFDDDSPVVKNIENIPSRRRGSDNNFDDESSDIENNLYKSRTLDDNYADENIGIENGPYNVKQLHAETGQDDQDEIRSLYHRNDRAALPDTLPNNAFLKPRAKYWNDEDETGDMHPEIFVPEFPISNREPFALDREPADTNSKINNPRLQNEYTKYWDKKIVNNEEYYSLGDEMYPKEIKESFRDRVRVQRPFRNMLEERDLSDQNYDPSRMLQYRKRKQPFTKFNQNPRSINTLKMYDDLDNVQFDPQMKADGSILSDSKQETGYGIVFDSGVQLKNLSKYHSFVIYVIIFLIFHFLE
ncbi:uncharacterized protein LOC118188826 [Stegodyphus dumicola]|uniref:uncharacterized protein LOC118188826 n=1 Tax=Stegodyphus dumicola TaxID=202533 RepID=UPI0015AC9C3E|nr:uncharacterized protein LOC118188826 [Stegodyphus dumicola]